MHVVLIMKVSNLDASKEIESQTESLNLKFQASKPINTPKHKGGALSYIITGDKEQIINLTRILYAHIREIISITAFKVT